MKKSIFMAMLAFVSVFAFSSCCDDDDVDYTSYLIGSWDAGEVSVVTNELTGELSNYIWTFNSGGRGAVVLRDDQTVLYDFTYDVTSYSEKSGLSYDFMLTLTAYNPDGSVKFVDHLLGEKVNGKKWMLYTQGQLLLHSMKKR